MQIGTAKIGVGQGMLRIGNAGGSVGPRCIPAPPGLEGLGQDALLALGYRGWG